METTALSIGKSVLNGALGYAKSAVADEVALQLGVQRDKAFVTGELEMMQSFLMVAHEELDGHNKVIKTWVKQVRDVAYDVEDSLRDFVVRLPKQSWWRVPRTLIDRRHVAKQMKDLRAKVEDISQRNVRYCLIKGSSSTEPATASSAAMFGVDEARQAAKQHQSTLDLAQQINKEGEDLGVIGVWGTSGSVGHTSIIWEAYENPIVKMNFPCRAWVRVTCPFRPKEFIQNIVKQFRAVVGVTDILLELEAEKKGHELALEYSGYVNKKRYLIVLTDLSTIEEWHQIKACLPENKLGSRIIVSTEQVEVASLSPDQDSIVLELKQLSADQTIYAFYNQSSHDATNSWKPASSSKLPYTAENGIVEDKSNTDDDEKMMVQERLTRANTMSCVLEESQLIGRGKEKSDIIELIREASTQQFEVIALWGMGGLGKTTLIKDVQQRKEVSDMFRKHDFVTVLRPFKLEELLRTLAVQLDERKGALDFAGDTQEKIDSMEVAKLTELLVRLSEGKSYLIVLDDLSSAAEWDLALPILLAMKNSSLVVVITSRREDIAKHCCKKPRFIRLLNRLEQKDAFDLLTKKVFKDKTRDLAKDYPELVEPAKLILKRCNGLPLAIVTIGGFLADQPTKTAAEWRKLNEHISFELEMNPKFESIKTVLMKSYDGLPYYLKSCFLYFSIFPEDLNVRRRRLVYRWIAEGYSLDSFVADIYFMELIERSMILPTRNSVCSIQGFDSCQLHDLIRDISIAKSMEENLVFRLEEGCRPNTHGAVRHLAISSNWEGDKSEFESTVELSCIRSLTVFGEWKPFYMSDKMRFLRVLDLEGTKGLKDHHIKHIGKLLHLRYLSLRGCRDILHLPKSVGNLSQLETLDIKYTRILTLPKTITKLTKLRNLHACWIFGVKLPRGMRKLKTLHTLRYVDLGVGNVVVQEIKGLTSLRKLGVRGMTKENGLELCSAISSNLSRLESLSVTSGQVDLYDCFHDMSSPPENLQCLKLCGNMSKLPGWIKGLHSLVKLKLAGCVLSWDGATMQALGNLPNLSILSWLQWSPDGESITFPSGLFRSLVVLELEYRTGTVSFEPTSMPKLEVLRLRIAGSTGGFSGLEFLPSIKEVLLVVHHELGRVPKVKEDLAKRLANNQNRPFLKVERSRRKSSAVARLGGASYVRLRLSDNQSDRATATGDIYRQILLAQPIWKM